MCRLTVYGTPRPQGSMRAMVSKSTGRVITIAASAGTAAWRAAIRQHVAEQRNGAAPYTGPVRLQLEFVFAWPKKWLARDGQPKPGAPVFRHQRPDIDKLVRAVLDALTGVLWHDDAQVCDLVASKRYGPVPLLQIDVDHNVQ